MGLVFALFFVLPVVLVVVISFFDYQPYKILIPDFLLSNYRDVFSSASTYATYWTTLQLGFTTWIITLVLGFTIAYFLAFHVRRRSAQIVLLLLCTIPFWTSDEIRMISWIPLLGREGVVNSVLLAMGVVKKPVAWLLYSKFAVVVGYVHLYTVFMIVPIFNAMMRIDRALLEAAVDAGAKGWQVVWNVVLPLSKSGLAIGSIFVIAIVMGDFVTVNVLGGGQVASVGKMIVTDLSSLQFPPAAAESMVLLAFVILLIAVLVRVVDIRKEL
ncbi:putrescine transport system permease protein PotH [mine drainage metagenome]|uniref:Putrescine transport system permease protein PotH n=1 Tax=mine drainage metagenome TaxID=410659 RepID=A0A1J5RI43_9ZZZZ